MDMVEEWVTESHMTNPLYQPNLPKTLSDFSGLSGIMHFCQV